MTKIIKAILLDKNVIVKASLFSGALISGAEIYREMFNENIEYKIVSQGEEYSLEIDPSTHDITQPPLKILEAVNTLI